MAERATREKRTGERKATHKPKPARGGPAAGRGLGGAALERTEAPVDRLDDSAVGARLAADTAQEVCDTRPRARDESLKSTAGEPWRGDWRPPLGPMPALRAAAPRAVAVLEELQDEAPPAVRLGAANSILDRVLGKPAQAVALAVAHVGPVPDVDAIEALARAMVAGDDENP